MMTAEKETNVLIILVLLNASQILTVHQDKNVSGKFVLFHQEVLVEKNQIVQ